MKFKVYYKFYDGDKHCTRGGGAMRVADTSEQAEQSVYDVLVNTPEYKDGHTLEMSSQRMFSEYLSWNEAVKTLATMSVEEIDELMTAVRAAAGGTK